MLASGKNGNSHLDGKHKKKSSIFFLALLAIFQNVQSQTQNAAINNLNNYVHPVVKSTCAATLYPELCVSAVATSLEASIRTIKSPGDVIIASLNRTVRDAGENYNKIQNFISSPRTDLTEREKYALQDCLQVVNDGIEELRTTIDQLKNYNFSSYEKTEYLRTLLSAAMTNQETCLDGFSHGKIEEGFRRKVLGGGLLHVFRLCSNVLAMVKNLTDTNMAANKGNPEADWWVRERRLEEWPEWLSAGDRRLLQASSVTPNVTVAADGSGNFRTIQAAVDAAPERISSGRYIIKINAGVYRENVALTNRKTNLMFIGDGQSRTIITANRSVRLSNFTTFNSATVAIAGGGFIARDITFQNTAGPGGDQAVALRVNADLVAFYRCDMIAYQDTLYTHSLRQFFRRCIIIGTVDFIFGNAAVVFQDCDIHARRPGPGQRNMVTAQGRSDPGENTGIVIQNCRIGATADLQAVIGSVQTYLGRPWRLYSRTVVMFSQITNVIHPRGWFEWSGDFALDTLEYLEYRNTGAGAQTQDRVDWIGVRELTGDAEATQFTAERFVSAQNWLPATGFPFTLGL